MFPEVQVFTKSGLMVMNKVYSNIGRLLFTVVIIAMVMPAKTADNEIVMDGVFFKSFSKISSIIRDDYIEQQLNRIVIGRGIITEISEKERYKKKYRIVIESSDARQYGQKFLFYIFLDNRNTFDLLTKNSAFEFKGQLVGYTPLDTKRNEYILDIIFMDGSTIIE